MCRCPLCGRFLGSLYADMNGNGDIIRVRGRCKKHGTVEPTDWDADMFEGVRDGE